MADLAFPAATIITMISTIDRDPRGGAAHARLEIGPGPAPGSRRRVRAATRLRLPVVSGFHTNFHSYAKHYHAGWFVRVVAGYLRRFHNRTTATVVATADLRARLNALGFTNLSVLGRGVDSGLFTPERRCAALRAAWGVSEHDIVALYVGRIAPVENLELG